MTRGSMPPWRPRWLEAPILEQRRIRVLTLAATVYLSGGVGSMEEFAIAATAAWSVGGVIAVRNALWVEQPESTA